MVLVNFTGIITDGVVGSTSIFMEDCDNTNKHNF